MRRRQRQYVMTSTFVNRTAGYAACDVYRVLRWRSGLTSHHRCLLRDPPRVGRQVENNAFKVIFRVFFMPPRPITLAGSSSVPARDLDPTPSLQPKKRKSDEIAPSKVHPDLSPRSRPSGQLSEAVKGELQRFRNAKPLLTRLQKDTKFPKVATHEEDGVHMPKTRTMCFGGTMIREAAGKVISATAENHEPVASIAADTFLLAKRQEKETKAMIAAKFVFLLWPLIPFPVEGLRHARQTKQLMEKILEEEGANLDRLKQVDLSKMTLHQSAETTPIRHGVNLRSSGLPCNTPQTRMHLQSILQEAEHGSLNEILGDQTNYVPETIDRRHRNFLEGATLSEKGWQKIVALIIEPQSSSSDAAPTAALGTTETP